MTPARRFHVPDTVIAQTIAEETVILDLEAGIYFGLDPVGARIWELVAQGAPLDDMIDQILAEYDVSRERLQRDVDALVSQLLENSLVIETTEDA